MKRKWITVVDTKGRVMAKFSARGDGKGDDSLPLAAAFEYATKLRGTTIIPAGHFVILQRS